MHHAALGAKDAVPLEEVGADARGGSTGARSATGASDLPGLVRDDLGGGQRPVVQPAGRLLALALKIGIAR